MELYLSMGYDHFANDFFPFFHDVIILAGCLWIADAVASFVDTIANDVFAVSVVTHQVPHTGWRVFNHSDFVGFHSG